MSLPSTTFTHRLDYNHDHTNGIGTALYRAPEQDQSTMIHTTTINQQSYNSLVDIYSLGIVLYEMSLKPFQTTMERIETIKKLRDHSEFSIEFQQKYENNDYLRELILWMVQKNPLQRPTIHEILESNLLKQYQNSLKMSNNNPTTTITTTTTTTTTNNNNNNNNRSMVMMATNSNENNNINQPNLITVENQESSNNFFVLSSLLSQIDMIKVPIPFVILKEIGTIINQMTFYYIHLNPLQLNLTFNKLKLAICELEKNIQGIITSQLLNHLILVQEQHQQQQLQLSSISTSLSGVDPSISSITNGRYCMVYSTIDGYYDMILYTKECIEEYYRHTTG